MKLDMLKIRVEVSTFVCDSASAIRAKRGALRFRNRVTKPPMRVVLQLGARQDEGWDDRGWGCSDEGYDRVNAACGRACALHHRGLHRGGQGLRNRGTRRATRVAPLVRARALGGDGPHWYRTGDPVVSSPGVNFGDDAVAVQIARDVNAAAAEISAANPGRLSFFGALPLPDVGASLDEIRRCFDELGADGIALLSNVHGVYLGDERYKSVWRALDGRGAVVFIHPTAPPHGESVSLGRPYSVVEFIFDEARTVIDMIFAGVLLDYPRIKFVITHSGGALPVIADRASARYTPPKDSGVTLRDQLGRLWFDCAGTPLPTAP